MNPSPQNSVPRLLLVIAALPSRADALSLVAAHTGLTLADVKLRLTGALPRVLLSDVVTGRVRALSVELEQQGFVTLVCDPVDAPRDEDRILARRLELSPGGLVAIDRGGAEHAVSAADITLFQRGWRISAGRDATTTSEKKVSLGRAVLTGGLSVSKTVKKTSARVSESREAFVLVQSGGHQPEVMLYERHLDFRFLGDGIQPAAYGNLTLTVERLRAMAPRAPLDERVAQPGFVQRMESAAAGDPLDLALHLIRLSYLRQATGGKGSEQ